MKVVLDIDVLLAENKITPNEYEKLKSLASQDTSSLAFSMLVSFGIIAISLGALVLMPSFHTAIAFGIIFLLVGAGLSFLQSKWVLIAKIISILGVLSLVAGLGLSRIPWLSSIEFSSLILVVAAICMRNAFLMVLGVLAFLSALGSSTYYSVYASSYLIVRQPIVVVVVFSLLAYFSYLISKVVSAEIAGVVIVASRTSLFLVNVGFWLGSLWGSHMVLLQGRISPLYFTVVWALALLAGSVFAWRHNKRWMLNCCCVFAAILFYTQWFSQLKASPLSLLIAGCIAVACAVAIKWINEKMGQAIG